MPVVGQAPGQRQSTTHGRHKSRSSGTTANVCRIRVDFTLAGTASGCSMGTWKQSVAATTYSFETRSATESLGGLCPASSGEAQTPSCGCARRTTGQLWKPTLITRQEFLGRSTPSKSFLLCEHMAHWRRGKASQPSGMLASRRYDGPACQRAWVQRFEMSPSPQRPGNLLNKYTLVPRSLSCSPIDATMFGPTSHRQLCRSHQ